MKKTIYRHLFLLLAIILAGTGRALAYTDPVLRGDANNDTEVNIADVGAIISRINYATYVLHEINADANGDGEINIADVGTVISIINYSKVDANGTIEDWTEGNTGDELEPQPLGEDEEEDNNYGD